MEEQQQQQVVEAGKDDTFMSLEVLRQLPKAELHCHLDGSVRPATILELAREQGVDVGATTEPELRRRICVDDTCASLEQYLVGFGVTLSVLQQAYAITRAVFEVAEDSVADGVRGSIGLSLSAVMEAACDGLYLAELSLPITCRLIVCGMRHMPSSVSSSLARVAWRYGGRGVVAFDLAGPEHGFASKHHAEAFAIVRSKCLNCTLHSGEGAGVDYVADAITTCGAHRIGHGVALRADPTLMQTVADRGIAIEVCMTSNVHTKAVPDLGAHPVRLFFDAGVTIVPCTDNRTVSQVRLSGEYDLLQRRFAFSPKELVRVLDNGFASAFLEPGRRRRLRVEALRTTLSVLRAAGVDVEPILRERWAYYDLGVPVKALLTTPGPTTERRPYWKENQNPPITHSVIQSLPKSDLHCRFDCSITIDLAWRLFSRSERDLASELGTHVVSQNPTTLNELRALVQRQEHTHTSAKVAKWIIKSLLQTKDNLKAAVLDILTRAKHDNVKYMEIMIRPKTHIKEGLSEDEVMEVLTTTADEHAPEGVKVNWVLYASTNADEPVTFFSAAQLALKWRSKGVVAFGVYGDSEIDPNAITLYRRTWDILKENHLPVAMLAGQSSSESILQALHVAGSGRISGAFTAHKDTALMRYLSMHKIPVELAPTKRLGDHTQSIQSFSQSLISLLMEQGVPVTLCTFRSTLDPRSRTDIIHDAVTQSDMSVCDLLTLLGNGFQRNFEHLQQRHVMYTAFRREAHSWLKKHGYALFYRIAWLAGFGRT